VLGREPDEAGFNFWSDRILDCASDADCIRSRRIAVAAEFFIHQEFQQSGAFIYNLYEGSLSRRPEYGEYAIDRQQVVGGPHLEAEKQAFAESFVQRGEFIQKYPASSTAEGFVDALLAGDKTSFHEWEANTPYFDGCLPIEVMAERGRETLRHGPMKPVGLTNPQDPATKSYAIVQLRQDNKLGTLYNMVGFQTKLKYGAQQRIFHSIPGLENAEFARFGGLHRNTFLNSPKLLDSQLRLRAAPRLRFAGQMTGCEGYVESASVGLIAGLYAAAEARGRQLAPPPATTALGSLLGHITGGHIETIEPGSRSFQPMNINFGLFPPLASPPTKKADGTRLRGNEKTVAKKQAISARALADLDRWIADNLAIAAAA